MKENFSGLVEYLDRKFNAIDKRFNHIDERFESINQKLDVKEINFGGLKQDFKNLQALIAVYSRRVDVYLQEVRALSRE